MTVRRRLALTIFATGVLTALCVIATVLVAFQRFEHESTYYRASAFLERVAAMHPDLFERHARAPGPFTEFLRTLVLFEPDSQLYLLDAQGTVLASTGTAKLPPGFKVALGPVHEALHQPPMPYVMGDDPERMDADAVIAAAPLRMGAGEGPPAGYLYLVSHKPALPPGGLAMFGSAVGRPALALIAGVLLVSMLLALSIVAAVTRPLRRLSAAVNAVTRDGLDGAVPPALPELPDRAGSRRDEFVQLASGFHTMLATLRRQWDALRRLDHFRREGVSNLSHDLRSPLTATVACLETLDGRWAGEPARADDRRLLEVALRNTRNAARLVQSLGDLALLDEPGFALRADVLDARELLGDIALRFQARAAAQGVTLTAEHGSEAMPPPRAALDVELFERAIANLVDNALRFVAAGGRITLSAHAADGEVRVQVADTGAGIAPEELPQLFDRFYQSRRSVAPAMGEGGKGLGLAIVKRIAELHGGAVEVHSVPGAGTVVTLCLPAAGA